MESFEKELKNLINIHSKENASNTPDFILATFMNSCLTAFNVAVTRRDFNEGRFTQPDGPEEFKDNQLTQCMPMELRDVRDTTLRPPTQDTPEGARVWFRSSFIPLAVRLQSYKGVEGHKPECEIELAPNWRACTCERG